MSKLSRKEMELKIREQYIITAAKDLFLTKGISNTTMDNIAEEAQISKTTLYKHFRSKDELELLVSKEIHSIKMDYIFDRIDSNTTGITWLRQFGWAYFNFFKANPKHLQFQLKHDYLGINIENIRTDIMKIYEVFFNADVEFFNQKFNEGIALREIKPNLDSNVVLESFYVFLRSILNHILILDSKTTAENLHTNPNKHFEYVLDIFIDGLKPVHD